MLSESLTAAFSEVAISYVLFILGFALFLALCYPRILMSHLQEYLLLPAASEWGLTLDCRKGFKMKSVLAKRSDQHLHLAGCISPSLQESGVFSKTLFSCLV